MISDFITHATKESKIIDTDQKFRFINYISNNIDLIMLIMTTFETDDSLTATSFNDFYKLKMYSVITNVRRNLNVCFGLDLRNEFYRDLLMVDEDLYKMLCFNLSRLSKREFNKDILMNTPGHSISEEEIDLLCSYPLIDEFTQVKFDADETNTKVVLSIYKAYDCVLKKNRVYIEATGPWYRATWLETTMMQVVYQTLLEHKLNRLSKSYGVWLYEAMFRCFKSIEYAREKNIYCALFSGRRSGGMVFLMIQNMMMNHLYYPDRYLGSSSFDCWYFLKDYIEIKPPIGTHAHEISMVFSKLFNDSDLVLSQLISHYSYYVFANNREKIPMLPDTFGTKAFMRAATSIKIGRSTFFDTVISSARQDSGEVEHFSELMNDYGYNSLSIMASEIDTIETLDRVCEIPNYKSFGAGGFFGDSEKVFERGENISMAVKVVRIYSKDEILYPIKLGDGHGKVTLDTYLPQIVYKKLISDAVKISQNTRVNLSVEQSWFETGIRFIDSLV